MEERREMPFGKKFRAGNFEFFKITKSLSKKEVNMMRDEKGIPVDIRKHLNRGGLPYIIIQSISGGWSLSFVIGTIMYAFIEAEWRKGEEGAKVLHKLFIMMYSDTAILADDKYWKDKEQALKSFLERQRAKEETAEEKAADDKILEEMQKEESARADMSEMSSALLKEAEEGGSDEGK